MHLRLSELITINLFCFILSRLLVYLGRTTERIESNFFLNSFPLFGRSIDAVGCPDLRVAPISLHVDHGCIWRWKHFGLGKNYVFLFFVCVPVYSPNAVFSVFITLNPSVSVRLCHMLFGFFGAILFVIIYIGHPLPCQSTCPFVILSLCLSKI